MCIAGNWLMYSLLAREKKKAKNGWISQSFFFFFFLLKLHYRQLADYFHLLIKGPVLAAFGKEAGYTLDRSRRLLFLIYWSHSKIFSSHATYLHDMFADPTTGGGAPQSSSWHVASMSGGENALSHSGWCRLQSPSLGHIFLSSSTSTSSSV